MIKSVSSPGKVLPFVVPQAPQEGKLEKWFRGIIQTNQELVTALERLRDLYQLLVADKPFSEADHAILIAVQITLSNAKKARLL